MARRAYHLMDLAPEYVMVIRGFSGQPLGHPHQEQLVQPPLADIS